MNSADTTRFDRHPVVVILRQCRECGEMFETETGSHDYFCETCEKDLTGRAKK